MRPKRAAWSPWVWRLSLVLAAAMALSACGGETEDELSGHFGPGIGSVPAGPFDTVSITKESGAVVGHADYDPAFFDVVLGFQSPDEFENLADDATTPTIVVALVRISGREDTPCRFQAAVLARDANYDILESGPRKNSRNLDFYQVNLKKGSQRLSLFCVTLRDQVGTAVQVITSSAALIKSSQVHYILNSIRKS